MRKRGCVWEVWALAMRIVTWSEVLIRQNTRSLVGIAPVTGKYLNPPHPHRPGLSVSRAWCSAHWPRLIQYRARLQTALDRLLYFVRSWFSSRACLIQFSCVLEFSSRAFFIECSCIFLFDSRAFLIKFSCVVESVFVLSWFTSRSFLIQLSCVISW